MKQQHLTLTDVIALLAKRCEEAGSQRAFAEANKISAQYVNDVLKQKREPGDAILKALGLQKMESYRMVAIVRADKRNLKVELKLADAPWGSIPARGWRFDPDTQEFVFEHVKNKRTRYKLSKAQNDPDYWYGDVPISVN